MTTTLPRPGTEGVAAFELAADTISPVAAALRLRDRLAFILESVEGGARYGRYSMVGVRGRILSFAGDTATILDRDYAEVDRFTASDPLEALRAVLPQGTAHGAAAGLARVGRRLPRLRGGRALGTAAGPRDGPGSACPRRSSICPTSSSSSTTSPRPRRSPRSTGRARTSGSGRPRTGWPSRAPTKPRPACRTAGVRRRPTGGRRALRGRASRASSPTSTPARCSRRCWRGTSACPARSGRSRSTGRCDASTPRRTCSRSTSGRAARCSAPLRSCSSGSATASSRRGPIAGTRPRGEDPAATSSSSATCSPTRRSCRARDARRPRSQRRRPRRRGRQRPHAAAPQHRALLARHAHRVGGRGPPAPRPRRVRRGPRRRSPRARCRARRRSGRCRRSRRSSRSGVDPTAVPSASSPPTTSRRRSRSGAWCCIDGIGHVQAGAGIVADSVPARESAEVAAKAGAVLAALARGRGRRDADGGVTTMTAMRDGAARSARRRGLPGSGCASSCSTTTTRSRTTSTSTSRSSARMSRSCATTRSASTTSRRARRTASSSRPGPSRPENAGITLEVIRR